MAATTAIRADFIDLSAAYLAKESAEAGAFCPAAGAGSLLAGVLLSCGAAPEAAALVGVASLCGGAAAAAGRGEVFSGPVWPVSGVAAGGAAGAVFSGRFAEPAAGAGNGGAGTVAGGSAFASAGLISVMGSASVCTVAGSSRSFTYSTPLAAGCGTTSSVPVNSGGISVAESNWGVAEIEAARNRFVPESMQGLLAERGQRSSLKPGMRTSV